MKIRNLNLRYLKLDFPPKSKRIAAGLLLSVGAAHAEIDSSLTQKIFKKGNPIEFVRLASDGNPIVAVEIERLKVTQEFIGKKIVIDEMLPRYIKKSAEELQKKSLSDPVEGILFRSSDGQYSVLHLDGHHRSYTYQLYNEKKPAHIKMAIKLIDDYTGTAGGKKLAPAEMAKDLVIKKNKTYVTSGKTEEEKFKFLLDPTHDQITEVKNCDLRTDVGSALYFLDWKSEHFKDYLEFYIGEDLTPGRLGCADPKNQNYPDAQTESRLSEVQKQIFAEPGCKVLKRLQTDYRRMGHENEAIRALIKSKARFDHKFPALKNRCPLSIS
jgi:hypothetical protein